MVIGKEGKLYQLKDIYGKEPKAILKLKLEGIMLVNMF